MATVNVIAAPIRPELPKVIDHEQIFVYVPAASAGGAGLATFDSDHFIVDNTGLVKINLSKEVSENDDRPIASSAVFRAIDDIGDALSEI